MYWACTALACSLQRVFSNVSLDSRPHLSDSQNHQELPPYAFNLQCLLLFRVHRKLGEGVGYIYFLF